MLLPLVCPNPSVPGPVGTRGRVSRGRTPPGCTPRYFRTGGDQRRFVRDTGEDTIHCDASPRRTKRTPVTDGPTAGSWGSLGRTVPVSCGVDWSLGLRLLHPQVIGQGSVGDGNGRYPSVTVVPATESLVRLLGSSPVSETYSPHYDHGRCVQGWCGRPTGSEGWTRREGLAGPLRVAGEGG